MPLLTDYDLNAVRLRVWVNPDVSPANGWCDIEDLVNKAILADNEGLDVMVCIHYSDHWADPGQQNKPAAWSNMTVNELETAIANHTTDILTALDAEGITTKWVQIGNETNDGMLWETGKASTGGFANYASFLNSGSLAVKTFDSSIETILHLANGNNNNLYQWNIGGLLNNGLVFNRFDIIGMSLYPEEDNWKQLVDDTYNNMNSIKSQYNKDVMMVEVGFSSSRPDITYQFLVYMMEKTRQANGLGVFYWEPIARSPFTSYGKGAWDDDGSPSIAMDAFLLNSTLSQNQFEITPNFSIFPNPSTQEINISSRTETLKTLEIYNLKGQLIDKLDVDALSKSINISNLEKGIYILKINNKQTKKFIKL
jgi:arabinogalactan endo-1,4-beta-galactosidase